MAQTTTLARRSTGTGTSAAPPQPSLSVGFVLANNFTLTALATFLDALRLAADDGDGSRQIRCHWTIMGTRPDPVRSSCGACVARWEPLRAPRDFDYIVVVGGLLHQGPALDDETVAYLRGAAAQGVTLVGVCTGGFILSRIGLMTNRRCCVSWYHHRDFIEEFPDLVPVADQLFVVDRDRITCSGGAGVADLAAHLIERHLGRAAAQKTMHIMLIDKARPANQSQPQPPTETEIANERVRRAILLMEQNLTDPLSVEEIARRLHVSTRQFERLFRVSTGRSPVAFYRLLRLRYGYWMLRNTRRSVTAIAMEAGFADCAHFSRQFREEFHVSPSAVRGAAGTAGEGAPESATPPPPAVFRSGVGLSMDLPDRRLFE
ncbi:GlxA family transcriptional regulator [Azospirillum sp. ST 5-10]|uniref:GlxA family transcriptional regulator n=1 Tax=unclassified Azospirillum TaxID=2630922 RepID=UPI003F4A42E4